MRETLTKRAEDAEENASPTANAHRLSPASDSNASILVLALAARVRFARSSITYRLATASKATREILSLVVVRYQSLVSIEGMRGDAPRGSAKVADVA